MFNFLKEKISSVYKKFTTKLNALFNRTTIDHHYFDELYTLLIESDVGVATTKHFIAELKKEVDAGTISSGPEVKAALEKYLLHTLQEYTFVESTNSQRVIMLVGINGSGKTTAAAKLAYYYTQQSHKVVLVAADTFRAAAPEQLALWANKIGVALHQGITGEDPSAVIYKGCLYAQEHRSSIIIIDTAGRLQTKEPLMKELNKMQRTVHKVLPQAKLTTLLSVDAMLGQNSLVQAHLFNEVTPLDGIILTKLDGTAKGGIIFAIQQELKVPVAYLSMGEQLQDFKGFVAQEYLNIFFHHNE